MRKKEKEFLETIALAYSNMSEFDKGYILGVAESKVKEKKEYGITTDPEPKAG